MLSFIQESSLAQRKKETPYLPGPFDGEMSPIMRKLATAGLIGGAVGTGYLINKYYNNEPQASPSGTSVVAPVVPEKNSVVSTPSDQPVVWA